jgi:hypothetical protein
MITSVGHMFVIIYFSLSLFQYQSQITKPILAFVQILIYVFAKLKRVNFFEFVFQ